MVMMMIMVMMMMMIAKVEGTNSESESMDQCVVTVVCATDVLYVCNTLQCIDKRVLKNYFMTHH